MGDALAAVQDARRTNSLSPDLFGVLRMRDDLFAEASQEGRFGRPVPERKKLNSHLYLSCQTLDHAVPKPLHFLISLGQCGRNAPVREPFSRKAEDLKKPLPVFLS